MIGTTMVKGADGETYQEDSSVSIDPYASKPHTPTSAQLTQLQIYAANAATARTNLRTAQANLASAQAAQLYADKQYAAYNNYIYGGRQQFNTIDGGSPDGV